MAQEKDSFTLNIGVGSSTNLEIKSSQNQKSKRKGLRKKDSSAEKRKTTNDEDSESDYETYKKLKVKGNKPKQTQYMSSLFGNNPEVPSLESKEISPVCEEVFSNDTFKDFSNVHPFTVKALEESFGVGKATVVQQLALPVLMSGKDALVRSQTGSGKTLAYAVPIVEALHRVRPKLSRSDGIRAVVVLPTRELALQTFQCFELLVKSFKWLVPGLVVGGEKRKSEKARLRKGINILVGTPGRINDHSFKWLVPGLVVGGEKRKSEKARLRKGINILVGTPGRINDHVSHTQVLRLDRVQWLVLDEADRLLDLGYEREITSLVKQLEEQSQEKRQTVLLSATLTARVEQLAGLALTAPVRLDASQARDSELVIPQSLSQHYIVTPAKLRLVTLAAFIHWKCQVVGEGKMLVFMATQDMVDYHTELLSTVLTGTAEFLRLHGSMTQHDRTQVFQAFKAADSGVLLCTDVAARGLDLPSVNWIVQYTSPATAEEYVHRVGRTARVGHTGSAALFLVPSELGFISQLQDKRIRLTEEQMFECLDSLQTLVWEEDNRRVSGMEGAVTALQLRFETAVLEQKNLHSSACKAYISWVRFYSSYPKEARECFNFKDLHLGHFAKSFALRDPPTSIGGVGRPNFKQTNHNRRPGRRELQYQPKAPPRLRAAVSEFSSGLEPPRKKKKHLV